VDHNIINKYVDQIAGFFLLFPLINTFLLIVYGHIMHPGSVFYGLILKFIFRRK